jgi:DNA polymerase III delta subunit
VPLPLPGAPGSDRERSVGRAVTGAPLAYFWGDDAFGLRRSVEQFGRDLENGGQPVETWHADPADGAVFDALTLRLGTAPLFGGGVVAVVPDPVALLRSREDQDRVVALLDRVAPGNGLVFTELSASGAREPAAASARVREAIERAGGTVRRLQAPPPGRLEPWIAGRAAELGIDVEPGAVRLLAERVGGGVREGDVDRRRQTELADAHLQLLALYRVGARVRREDVELLVTPTVPASTWAFLDAVGTRRAGDAAALASALLAEGTALAIIVTQLHRRLRQLLEIRDRLAHGAAPGDLVRLLKLNPFRAEILARQAMHWDVTALEAALDGLLEIDLASKGLAADARSSSAPMTGPLALGLWLVERVAP